MGNAGFQLVTSTALTTGPWASMNATQRGALVHKLGDLIRDNARELAEYEVRDNGTEQVLRKL